MARPIGIQSKLKDNSKKNYREHEEFNKGKKLGRPKQVWVIDSRLLLHGEVVETGHWEKVK